MEVCYITNEKYAMPTCVSLISLIEHHRDTELNVHIICDGVQEKSKEAFVRLESNKCHIELLEAKNELYSQLAKKTVEETGTYVSRSALYKFDIPLMLSQIDTILYLDGDVIINGNLSGMYSTDLSGHYLAAVPDMGVIANKRNGVGDYAKRVNIDDGEYFNSGVMLLNTKLMREDCISERLMDYRVHGINYFMDQDALNVCMGRKCVLLPFQYNFRAPLMYESSFSEVNKWFFESRYKSYKDCLDEQLIIHATGPYKPWEYQIQYLTDLFIKYYDKSLYAENKLELEFLEAVLYKRANDMYDEIMRRCNEISDKNNKINQMEWRFPFFSIPKNSRIILFGAGEVGKSYRKMIACTQYCQLSLWVDSNEDLWGDEISPPKEIRNCEYDYILVANSSLQAVEDIKAKLKEMDAIGHVVTMFDIPG